MIKSKEHSYQAPRSVRPVVMTAEDVADFGALAELGINFSPARVERMAEMFAMDDQQGLITTATITTPVQFLQAWLPGFVKTITAARKIDTLIGRTTAGSWEDEEVVQGVLEPIGVAVPYGDMTQVPFSSWNVNFERRTVVRFEKGLQVSVLEEARAARIRMNTAAEKRNSSALALEVQRNAIGFYGYNSGNNRTYGFLNDPSLPSYVTVATGAASSTHWSTKTFIEITNDIRTAVGALQTQSQDMINPGSDPTTLVVSTNTYAYLSTVAVYGNLSVMGWIRETYPQMRVESAPQLNSANGGANVFYLYAEKVEDGASDNSRVWDQIVPAQFMALGIEKRAKSFVEDYAMATAGALLKRPYGVVRYTGI